jgi:hypothetical protein
MKINKKKCLITLSPKETKQWEDGGPDGFDFRSSVRRQAAAVARQKCGVCEIYAARSQGGWMADQVRAD